METYELAEVAVAEPGASFMGLLFSLLPLLILGLLVVAIVVLVVMASKSGSKKQQAAQNASAAPGQPQALQGKAKVITKRVHGGTMYYVGLELTDGSRLELNVTGAQYGVIVEGDEGVATWQGSSLVSFQREV